MHTPRWIAVVVALPLFAIGCADSASDVPVSTAPSSVGFVVDDVPGRETGPHCTGTLVAPRVVMTAAHCILSPEEVRLMYTSAAGKWGIAFGIGNANEANRVRATKIVLHPQYDPTHQTPTDLAYLVLEREVPNGAPAHLAPHRERCGYESFGYGPIARATLRGGAMSRASFCAPAGLDDKGFIRAKGEEGAICFGFGGGPLTAPDNGEVTGILSFGESWCGDEPSSANYFVPFEHPVNTAFVQEALLAQ